jgi:hypothetical protein
MGTSYNPKIVTDGLVLNLDPANVKSYPAGQDTFVNNVSLLLDGQSLTDKSQNNFTVTNSSAAISTAEAKYGNSSIYFNGSSFVSVPDSSAFSFGTGDFTIETWLKLGAAITATSGDASFRSIVNKYSAGSTGTEDAFYVFLNNAAGTMQFNVGFVSNTTASNFAFNITGVDTSLNSVWNHIAVVRSSGSLKVYFNGTQIGSTQTYSSSINQGNLPLLVGARTYAPYDLYLNGYIDDLRITKSAIYTANFTPPSAPLSLPGVVTDITKNKINSTLIAGPTYSSTNGGSLLFDGGTQYINIGSNSNLILGTNDFALELWFKPVSRAQLYPFLLHNGIGAGSAINCWQINDRHGNNPTLATFWCYNYNAFSSSMLASASAISNGNWYHLVITRIGNIFSMYLNSVLQSTVTSSISVDGGASMNYGFNTTGQGGFNGNSSIIKVYKGKGLTSTEVLQNYNATKGRFGL